MWTNKTCVALDRRRRGRRKKKWSGSRIQNLPLSIKTSHRKKKRDEKKNVQERGQGGGRKLTSRGIHRSKRGGARWGEGRRGDAPETPGGYAKRANAKVGKSKKKIWEALKKLTFIEIPERTWGSGVKLEGGSICCKRRGSGGHSEFGDG